jgi:hypothetical protein
MKLLLEKVPEGVRVELIPDDGKQPVAFTLPPASVNLLVSLLPAAVQANRFRFEVNL